MEWSCRFTKNGIEYYGEPDGSAVKKYCMIKIDGINGIEYYGEPDGSAVKKYWFNFFFICINGINDYECYGGPDGPFVQKCFFICINGIIIMNMMVDQMVLI